MCRTRYDVATPSSGSTVWSRRGGALVPFPVSLMPLLIVARITNQAQETATSTSEGKPVGQA